MSETPGSCGHCGVAIDTSTADLDDQGRAVCSGCRNKATLKSGQALSTGAVAGAATSAAMLGFASFFFGVYAAGPAVFVGAGALIAARTADRLAPGSVPTSVYLAAGFGVVVGVLRGLGMCLLFAS